MKSFVALILLLVAVWFYQSGYELRRPNLTFDLFHLTERIESAQQQLEPVSAY